MYFLYFFLLFMTTSSLAQHVDVVVEKPTTVHYAIQNKQAQQQFVQQKSEHKNYRGKKARWKDSTHSGFYYVGGVVVGSLLLVALAPLVLYAAGLLVGTGYFLAFVTIPALFI